MTKIFQYLTIDSHLAFIPWSKNWFEIVKYKTIHYIVNPSKFYFLLKCFWFEFSSLSWFLYDNITTVLFIYIPIPIQAKSTVLCMYMKCWDQSCIGNLNRRDKRLAYIWWNLLDLCLPHIVPSPHIDWISPHLACPQSGEEKNPTTCITQF